MLWALAFLVCCVVVANFGLIIEHRFFFGFVVGGVVGVFGVFWAFEGLGLINSNTTDLLYLIVYEGN